MPSSQADPGRAGNAAPVERLWVVLPVYNEAGAIERVIAEWLPVLEAADPGFVLLVVDDGSTDETPRLLETLAAREPRVRILRGANQGHGAACRRGYEAAVAPQSDAGWILQIDSDGQCDPADFEAFWEGRSRHPLQLGRRSRREDGFLRSATSRALALLSSVAAGRLVRDPNVPFRLMRRDLLARALELLPPLGAEGGVELANAALTVATMEIEEARWVPIRFRRRLAGESHYRFRRMGALALGLLRWLVSRAPSTPISTTPARSSASITLATLAWCVLGVALACYGFRNLGCEDLWYDEVVQVHTSLGIHPMAEPFRPTGSLREMVWRNAADQLDPGGYGVLLRFWMRLFGTGALALHVLSALFVSAGLFGLAALAKRWTRHPLAPPAAVALALCDLLVREHALEVRPYALEMAGVWLAFWAADRMLERPAATRALLFGAIVVGLLGSRYSAFLTTGAIFFALLVQTLPWPARREPPLRAGTFAVALVLPLLAVIAVARWALPGLIHRASWGSGQLVDYLGPQKLGALSAGEAVMVALRHLVHPSVLALTLAAALAVWPARGRLGGAPNGASASRLVRHTALALLLLTVLAWPWHPWDPALKWSLYLRLVSVVCLLRLAVEALPWFQSRPAWRFVPLVIALGLISVSAWRTGTHERWRWDVARPALERIGGGLLESTEPRFGERTGGQDDRVAVDVHPTPGVRYYYEYGSLRGRPEYPRAFELALLGAVPTVETLCASRWLLSFDSIAALERRYPGFRFVEDEVADQLLRVSVADPADSPCGSSTAASIPRGSSERAR